MYLSVMAKNSKSKFFVWDTAQAFLGNEKGEVLTCYSNDLITMSFEQNGAGELTAFVWETDGDSGEVRFNEPVESQFAHLETENA